MVSEPPCVCDDTVWIVPKELADVLECPRCGPYIVLETPKETAVNETTVNHQQSIYGRTILAALSGLPVHVYAGTVPAAVVARRRAKNRVARQSRRLNRP